MTVANLYCSPSDVSRRLPVGALASSSSLVASSPASTDVVTSDGHGFITGDPLAVRAVEGGTLSAPLAEGTTYFAIRLSNSTLKLATTYNNAVAGTAVDLTSASVSMAIVREPDFDLTIEESSRWADTCLPAHLLPLEAPVHPLVRSVVADVAAKRMLNYLGQDSEIVTKAEIEGKAILLRFVSGMPLRGAAATSSANLAVTTTLTDLADSRGWCPDGSGTIP